MAIIRDGGIPIVSHNGQWLCVGKIALSTKYVALSHVWCSGGLGTSEGIALLRCRLQNLSSGQKLLGIRRYPLYPGIITCTHQSFARVSSGWGYSSLIALVFSLLKLANISIYGKAAVDFLVGPISGFQRPGHDTSFGNISYASAVLLYLHVTGIKHILVLFCCLVVTCSAN